ncbi:MULTISPECIES: phage recombination protein Bet [unclassified Neptuniibacter]|uniref:phage recombination protein Bet n=1 Tax=unclassified Neptuniibacter TaxID=2630693 RepID=UPI000C6C27DD|nr:MULTISPECIES: phage recombination protein Bet [unclassified Neptuniibacter]MAY41710.1 phage recombination protein Bet [Oceanospirillaceae bacterium]|tara:strand:- start:3386 stop:4228 length:843 start_codon:yes stop_codon:yes gene_type:complete
MSQQLAAWKEQNPAMAERGIDESTWNALCSTIYPGAKSESIVMAIDYCHARKLDIMLKPVHLVPMQVKDAHTGKKEFRDVPMPGIGLYRIQADRSGNYAGADEPEFGPTVDAEFEDAYTPGKKIAIRYPEWCKYTVYKIVGGERVSYKATEYWLENYATQKAASEAPNAMWKKRPFAQLAKCAEAQALRKAWPEIGAEPTAEEMAGKEFDSDMNLSGSSSADSTSIIEVYPDKRFEKSFPQWEQSIKSGNKTATQIIDFVKRKGSYLSDSQIEQLNSIGE